MTHWKQGFTFIILNALLLLLSACLGGAATQTEQLTFGSDALFEAGSSATLICSSACFDRAQCGRDPQQQDVVLLSSGGPAVAGHDRWQANNTPVTITTSQTRTVQKKQNVNDQYLIEFYQVQLPTAEQAWVAGWCIHQ